MGSAGSKVGIQYSEQTFQEGSLPSTPILTSKIKKLQELDPRSPSTHIARTPLQLPATSESLEVLNVNNVHIVNDETPVRNKTILLGFDPRSPTTEFQRTPIVINVEVEADIPKKIHNKNLDKAKASAVIVKSVPTSDKALLEKISSNIVPPKLLESSPIRSKTDVHKRRSFVGLLETNIDFTETDLDAVIFEKCKIKENLLNENCSAQKYISVMGKENLDPRSPTSDFIRTPLQALKKIELNDEEPDSIVEVETKCKHADTKLTQMIVRAQENEIEYLEADVKVITKNVEEINIDVDIKEHVLTPESNLVLETENEMIADEDLGGKDIELPTVSSHNGTVENVTVVCDAEVEIRKETKSAPITPTSTNIKVKSIPVISPVMIKKTKSAPATPPEVNITADVKELDKKLTNLIYQDQDFVICPRIVKLKEYKNRSPLRSCNSNEPEKKKSAQKLKVSDKPRKSDFAVSKIPVFKEKGKKSNVIQCENTPPRNTDKRKVKAKKSHWDNANTTLLI